MAVTVRLGGSVALLATASGLQAMLAIAIFPIATLFLEAAEFGVYALLMSCVALAIAVSDGGSALAIPAHFEPADSDARGRMIVTFAAISGTLGLAAGIFLLLFLPRTTALISLPDLPASIWIACAVLVPLRALATTSTVVFSVSGRGVVIAAQIAIQAIITFAMASFALLVLEAGLLSLFLGAIVGQIAGLAVAAFALRSDLAHWPSRRWGLVALANAPTAAFAGLADGFRVFAENAILARSRGLYEVGHYAHAKLYFSLGLTASNAVAHNIWSISLVEARENGGQFPVTGRVWEAAHLFLFIGGLATVAFGDEIIALLTNDVLTRAAAYVPWLVVIMLLKLSGRAAQATLFARGKGASITRTRTALTIATIASLPVVVSEVGGIGLSLGAVGLIAITIIEEILYRLYMRRRAARLRSIPFQDFWVATGVVGISVAAVINGATNLSLVYEAVAFVAAVFGILAMDWLRCGPVRMIASLRRSHT